MTANDDLWAVLDGCPAEALRWAGVAYAAGERDGWTAGWDASERDQALRWHTAWLSTYATLQQPAYAELQARRGES